MVGHGANVPVEDEDYITGRWSLMASMGLPQPTETRALQPALRRT
jgi:hypothetical protein